MTMLNPCHPGETLRDDLAASGMTVIEAAARLDCTRQALSRLLNGKAGIPCHGLGAGAHQLEQRELLDATTGGLRSGAGAVPAGGVMRDGR